MKFKTDLILYARNLQSNYGGKLCVNETMRGGGVRAISTSAHRCAEYLTA